MARCTYAFTEVRSHSCPKNVDSCYTAMDRYGRTSGAATVSWTPSSAEKWWSPAFSVLDLIVLLMSENSRTNSVWDLMMSTPEIQRAMTAVDLVKI